MKNKLIEMRQEHLIECDNQKCDYKVENVTGDPNTDISQYINSSCPKCGENLLTEKDYLDSLRMLKVINWVNKWFSWLTIFNGKNTKEESVFVKFNNGIKIKKDK